MRDDRFLVMDACIARPLRILYCPAIIPVKENRRLRRSGRTRNFRNIGKRASQIRDILKHSCMFMPNVINDRPVELLAGASALAPLKILYGIRSMGNRLQRGQLMHAWLLQFADRLPVCQAWRALHQ
ncbi:hypothetical protein D3C77_447870 [compost metagenome]